MNIRAGFSLSAPVLTALLLISCAQFDGLSMWTDQEGVVHVASAAQAPKEATPLTGGSYSVIDGDSRPLVLWDGGSRLDDAAWWRSRFRAAREAVTVSKSLEETAMDSAKETQLCVTATARAKAEVRMVSQSPTSVASVTREGTRLVQAPAGAMVIARDSGRETSTQCQTVKVSAAAAELVTTRRAQREKAERELRELEAQAVREGVPVREWY